MALITATGHAGGGWIPLGPAARGKGRPAVFVDKDGTLIHDVPYNVDVKKIRFRREAGASLRRLQQAGYALILVSNQSGIARQFFSEEDLEPVWGAIRARLAIFGVRLDGIYYCPHHPHGPHPRYGFECHCRKPRPGLLLRAAAQCGIDLGRSWLVGDILDDVEAGRRAGCRTVLLDVGSETEWRMGPERQPHLRAASLAEAADLIVAQSAPPEAAEWTA